MKKKLFILILTLALFLHGCGENTPEPTESDGPIELWVITEKTDDYGMNQQARVLKNEFQTKYDNVTVKLDILPDDESEREVYLESLRAQIMAGAGPDIYLLPVVDSVHEERLIEDVEQSMHNGLFADISAHYNNDTELNTDGLVTSVMDAGTIDQARYILPLRYDMMVCFADAAMLEECGITFDSTTNAIDLMDLAITRQNAILADSVLPYIAYRSGNTNLKYSSFGLSYLGKCMNYSTDSLTITKEDMAEFIQKYTELLMILNQAEEDELPIIGATKSVYHYVEFGTDFGSSVPLAVGALSNAMDYVAIANAEGREIAMYPISSANREVTANVTYYGAIGANCSHVELAYEYLRSFLTEDSQWEQNMDAESVLNYNMIASGWPVRSQGAVESLWENKRICVTSIKPDAEGESPRKNGIKSQHLTDADIPVLTATIDSARFQISTEWHEFGNAFYELPIVATDELSIDYIDSLAESLIDSLNWHLAEG